MTWPQVAYLARAAPQHQDVYFNMWRFGWIAHALVDRAARVLDGNIFYPEPRTLTFSDAMPVEAVDRRAAAVGGRAAGARAQPDAAGRRSSCPAPAMFVLARS